MAMRWNIHTVSQRLARVVHEKDLIGLLKQPRIFVPTVMIFLALAFVATRTRPKLYVETPSYSTALPGKPASQTQRPSIQLNDEEKALAGQTNAPPRGNALAQGGAYPIQITYTCSTSRVQFSALLYPTDPTATVGATVGGLRVAKTDAVVRSTGKGIYEWDVGRDRIPTGGAQLLVYTLVVNPNSPNRQANRDQVWRLELPGDICG